MEDALAEQVVRAVNPGSARLWWPAWRASGFVTSSLVPSFPFCLQLTSLAAMEDALAEQVLRAVDLGERKAVVASLACQWLKPLLAVGAVAAGCKKSPEKMVPLLDMTESLLDARTLVCPLCCRTPVYSCSGPVLLRPSVLTLMPTLPAARSRGEGEGSSLPSKHQVPTHTLLAFRSLLQSPKAGAGGARAAPRSMVGSLLRGRWRRPSEGTQGRSGACIQEGRAEMWGRMGGTRGGTSGR